jgi:hypothetical protein
VSRVDPLVFPAGIVKDGEPSNNPLVGTGFFGQSQAVLEDPGPVAETMDPPAVENISVDYGAYDALELDFLNQDGSPSPFLNPGT